MILAEKIVKLRKQIGWSQEELAEKMDVSRQSVSKWESTYSIPDLNKILKLAELFEVSTDYLLKDNIETCGSLTGDSDNPSPQISLETALNYVDKKVGMARLVAKGVFLCISSVVPLFTLLAMEKSGSFNISSNNVTALGVIGILLLVSIGISFFIRTNQYESHLKPIENEPFELGYGVHSVIKEKLQKFRRLYNLLLSISIAMFIFSIVPSMLVSVLSPDSDLLLMMLVVLILMVASGVYLLVPVSAKYEAYNRILKEEEFSENKSMRVKRVEKFAVFYWPLLTAVFLGWSLWTMNWGVTWIVWPVGGILFIALVGLMELFVKDDH